MLSINSKYLKVLSAIAIIAFGIFIRTHVFLQGVSLFGDEGAIVLNLYDKSYSDLFFPLNYDQQAPPFFLIISKFILMKYGLNEVMLRLVPYVSSIISLILFYLLCKKIFKNNISTLVATFLFALNMPLVEFSQILKPYSSDALFSILIMLAVLTLDLEKMNMKKIIFLSFLTVLNFWCAYSTVIFTFSFALLFLIENSLSRDYVKLKYSIIFAGINLAGILLYYFTNLHKAISSKYLFSFWTNNFGFFPNTYKEFMGLIHFIFNINSLYGLVFTSILFAFGAYFLFKNNSFKFWVVVSPILCSLLLGVLHLYPFADRLIIFLIPNFIILISSSLDFAGVKENLFVRTFTTLIVFIFIFSTNCIPYFFDFIKYNANYEKSFSKEYIALLKKEMPDKNAIIFTNPLAGRSILTYGKDSPVRENLIITENWSNPIDDLSKLPHKRIVYFYLAHNKINEANASNFAVKQNWIKKNCIILKETKIKDKKFIKCYVK